jgi:reactive intermediate/imine deaminase
MTKIVYPSPLPYPFAQAARAGDFEFVSGQLPFGPDGHIVHGPIEIQALRALENIKAALEVTGCTLSDVVKNMIWLEEERNFVGFNKVYADYFSGEPPARTTVGAKLMPDAKLEIETLAYKPLPN